MPKRTADSHGGSSDRGRVGWMAARQIVVDVCWRQPGKVGIRGAVACQVGDAAPRAIRLCAARDQVQVCVERRRHCQVATEFVQFLQATWWHAGLQRGGCRGNLGCARRRSQRRTRRAQRAAKTTEGIENLIRRCTLRLPLECAQYQRIRGQSLVAGAVDREIESRRYRIRETSGQPGVLACKRRRAEQQEE